MRVVNSPCKHHLTWTFGHVSHQTTDKLDNVVAIKLTNRCAGLGNVGHAAAAAEDVNDEGDTVVVKVV